MKQNYTTDIMNENYHVVTVARGGTVSILRNLTKEIAEQTKEKLTPHYVPGLHYCRDGDIEQIHILGPKQ